MCPYRRIWQKGVYAAPKQVGKIWEQNALLLAAREATRYCNKPHFWPKNSAFRLELCQAKCVVMFCDVPIRERRSQSHTDFNQPAISKKEGALPVSGGCTLSLLSNEPFRGPRRYWPASAGGERADNFSLAA